MKRSIALCAVFATAAMTAATGAARAQSGDVAKGERAFNLQCKACHTLERGGANTAGPNLYGLMGRRSGTMQGYGYVAFGRVVEGMDVVNAIRSVATGAAGPFPSDVPKTPIVIQTATMEQ